MFKVLSDGTVMIRPYEFDDTAALYKAVDESFIELHQWLPWCYPGYGIKDSAGWVKSRCQAWGNGEEYSFVIADATGKAFLGGTVIDQIEMKERVANLGYWVRTTCTGSDVATRAAVLTAQFAFNNLKLRSLEIMIAVGNTASQRVAEKAGAKNKGILRNRLRIREQFHDAVVYALEPKDLESCA